MIPGGKGRLLGQRKPITSAPNKIPAPTVKGAGKVADVIPKSVPKNWSRSVIEEAINDYKRSIALRKAEVARFDALGGGHLWARKAHYERIVGEENFLRKLEQAMEAMRCS